MLMFPFQMHLCERIMHRVLQSVLVLSVFVAFSPGTEAFLSKDSIGAGYGCNTNTNLLQEQTLPCNRDVSSPLWSSSSSKQHDGRTPKKKKVFTIADLKQEFIENPAKFQSAQQPAKRKYRRTRQRVDNPQQKYLYKNQRQKLKTNEKSGEDHEEGEHLEEDEVDHSDHPLAQAKEFGLVVGAQHCDPAIDGSQPRLMGQLKISDESGSGQFAYVIDKPAGWSVVGSNPKQARDKRIKASSDKQNSQQRKARKRVRIEDEDGSRDLLEFDESDMFAVMTPEEIEEFRVAMGNEEAKNEIPLVVERNHEPISLLEDQQVGTPNVTPVDTSGDEDNVHHDTEKLANLKRIAARAEKMKDTEAVFSSRPRPSIVSWLKNLKAEEGYPIKGGNFWTALSGATDVDDSGLVLLCPKANADNIFVERSEYVSVAGTGGFLAPRPKLRNESHLVQESIQHELVSKLRKGREDDPVFSIRSTVADIPSTCSSIVSSCQAYSEQGIRGDPLANPFDKRAPRRLIHCSSLHVSSLVCDDTVSVDQDPSSFPSDIGVYSERTSTRSFQGGSFLGRTKLSSNPLTNTYREINGVADGFPGWLVDRYDKWLYVQHDPKTPMGPLPSIHDGRTTGVYYLEATQDRSAMGSTPDRRPRLLEGQKAPESLIVVENGVHFDVSLEKDLSTGIFLDQRQQRAWLKENCCENTHVLNCFAHTGAFSVAAAVAGASTVSIDLSKKWLERLPAHLAANGLPFDERHDCIYGDCFDWLARLGRRGEKYDMVILDPPSTSVGKKKKRWSVRNNMDELVALAAPLVKRNGILWTTTNSASIHPLKFARLCRKGFEIAGVDGAKLERIQSMPSDFPTIGPQQVKNLVWRLP